MEKNNGVVINPNVRKMLAEHEFLAGLEEAHVEKLAEFAYLDTMTPDEYIFRAGEHAERCYLIREGQVALEVYDPRRGAVRMATLGNNRALGWSWLIPPHQWTFDARVIRSTTVIALDAVRFRRAMDEDHELGYHMLKRFTTVFADRLRASRLQLLDMYGPVG